MLRDLERPQIGRLGPLTFDPDRMGIGNISLLHYKHAECSTDIVLMTCKRPPCMLSQGSEAARMKHTVMDIAFRTTGV